MTSNFPSNAVSSVHTMPADAGFASSTPPALAGPKPMTEAEPTPKRGVSGVRVLVADDEPSSRSGLQTLLRQEGFDVTVAEDGYKALARLEETAPDVLLTDLKMPGLDGIELLEQGTRALPRARSSSS